MPQETVSIIVLTKDEEANLDECLRAVLAQLQEGDEVLVIDSASKDGTVAIAEAHARARPGGVQVHASPVNLTFGAARNLGVANAKSDIVVFLSADAVPEPEWLGAMRATIADADIVYGRQRHSPPTLNAATVSRGLRYHHFEVPADGLPERYASNVNAAYRRFVFSELRFDEAASGAEDVAFAKAARYAGHRIRYAPTAIVGHKDVASWSAEWRKHVREGAAHAQLRSLLGVPTHHLAWAFAVGFLAILAIVFQSPWALAGTILVFFAPTLRRLRSPVTRRYRALVLLAGAAVAPLFDLAFVASYLRRRVTP